MRQPSLPLPRRGATLLLALLILGSFMATSVAVGTIVAQTIRAGRAIDDGIVAAAAGESAAEELLFDVRKRGVVAAGMTEGTLPSGATWRRTVTTTVPELSFTLTRDRIEQVDIFPADGSLAETNIRFLEIVPIGTPDARAWLEVSWVPWIAEQQTWAPAVVQPAVGPSGLAADGVIVDLAALPIGVSGGRPSAYRVRFRALHADLGPVRVRALDRDRAAIDLPGRIRAVVRGTFGTAVSASIVEFPPRAPLAPVFDYVLFSECDIVKGDVAQCP